MTAPIRIQRAPAQPIRLDRLVQTAPVIRLPGVGAGSGGSGGAAYEATFAAALQWVVNHNLGRRPAAVRILTPGGVEAAADVTETSLNQLVVSFAGPQAGRVVVF